MDQGQRPAPVAPNGSSQHAARRPKPAPHDFRTQPSAAAAPMMPVMSSAIRGVRPVTVHRRATLHLRPHSAAAPSNITKNPAPERKAPDAQSSTVTSTATPDYFATDSRPIILYDGVCNFCNGGVNFLLDLDKRGQFRFAALQSTCGRALLERSGRGRENLTSMVLVEKDTFHVQSAATLMIAWKLGGLLRAASLPFWLVPKPVRDAGYDLLGNNRYQIMGMRNVCRVGDARYADRFIE